MAFIEIRNLRKIYRLGNEKVYALKNIDLEINKGEVCCILGTSGSGKSTLLNMLAGLEKPTRGDIFINGVNIAKLNERRLAKFRQENTGFVFQSYNLIPQLTALENVGMPLMFKGLPKSIRNKNRLNLFSRISQSIIRNPLPLNKIKSRVHAAFFALKRANQLQKLIVTTG